jgi:hypothetical protein
LRTEEERKVLGRNGGLRSGGGLDALYSGGFDGAVTDAAMGCEMECVAMVWAEELCSFVKGSTILSAMNRTLRVRVEYAPGFSWTFLENPI